MANIFTGIGKDGFDPSNPGHNHDDRYYTEDEIDNKFEDLDLEGNYAPKIHTHDIDDISGLQDELNNKADLDGATFTGDISANNLTGVNTGDQNAEGVNYNNSTSLLTAIDVQGAIDELSSEKVDKSTTITINGDTQDLDGNLNFNVDPVVKSTKEIFVAGEEITQDDIDNGNNALCINSYAIVLEQNTKRTDGFGDAIGNNNNQYWEQAQGIVYTGPLTGLMLQFFKVGNGGDTVFNIELYSNASLTTLLGTSNENVTANTIASSSWSAPSDYTFTFNGINATGNVYAKLNIVSGSPDALNFINIISSGSDVYAGNHYYITQAGTVTLSNQLDWAFKVLNSNNIGRVYKTDASNINKINFIGFATTPALANENVIVDTSGLHTRTIDSGDIGKDFYLGFEASGVSNSSTIVSTSSGGFASISYDTSRVKQGQTFTTVADRILRNITFSIKKIGSPIYNLYCKIYEGDKITPLYSATNSIPTSSLTTSFVNNIFNFDDVILSAGTVYFIEISSDGALNTSNYVDLNSGSSTYNGGNRFSQNSSGDWTNENSDLNFTIQMGIGNISNISTTPGINVVNVGKATNNGILINTNGNKTNNSIGIPVSKTSGIIYLAETSGFINAYTGDSAAILSGLVGPNNPPTITIAQSKQGKYGSVDERSHICFPVAKGYYYQVVNASVVYFTPNI